jgi:hypothetical protein
VIQPKELTPLKRSLPPVSLCLCLLLYSLLWSGQIRRSFEEGSLSIFFKGEKVGYEEYTWEAGARGFLLSVEGRLTKPVAIEIERLTIELDPNFIPVRYTFLGTMSGLRQEITSVISDGLAENTRKVAGQEQTSRIQIKRDAVLLPNPVMAPYLVIGKRFGCGMDEKRDLSAYIIPQMETPITIETSAENPCLLNIQFGETLVELEIDDGGRLKRLRFPSQDLEAVDDFYTSKF